MGTASLQKTVLLNSFHFIGERKDRITSFDVSRLNMYITNISNEPNIQCIRQYFNCKSLYNIQITI